MPANPIQRKTRNSFLLGMLLMLILAVGAIALLWFGFLSKKIVDLTKETGEKVYAYKLTSAIKSGDAIKTNKVEMVALDSSQVPADYVNSTIDVSLYNSKLDLQAGTILSSSMIYQEKMIANSTRVMEYNMLTLPSTLRIGDYIDIRFTMPSGQDYIVLSKKQIKNIQNKTITLHLTEDEILMMSSAIIESYVISASNLYAIQYLEAGMQNAATPTYSVNAEVYQLIQSNFQKGINIEDYANINASYNSELRATIEQELGMYSESANSNVESGLNEQKENAMELYLSGLAGY